MGYKDAETRRAAYAAGMPWAKNSRRAARAAKKRRTGTCVICGGVTRYGGHQTGAVSKTCAACNAKVAAEREKARRGTGEAKGAILAYLAEPHTYTEIWQHFGRHQGWAGFHLDALVRYGLVVRVRRGVYQAADGRVEG